MKLLELTMFMSACGGLALATPTTQNFDSGGTPYTVLAANRSNPTPATVTLGGPTGNFLRLATSPAVNMNSIAFDRTDMAAQQIVADFDFRMTPPAGGRSAAADGFGFAFLNTSAFGSTGSVYNEVPERPLFAKSLGIGFRIYGTNTVYVTYDGVQIGAVDLSGQVDLASGQFIHAQITMRPGGGFSDVSVVLTTAGSAPVTAVNRLGIPQFLPYPGRPWFGARSGGLSALHDLDNISLQYTGSSASPTPFVQYLRSANARMVSYSPTSFNPNRVPAGGPLVRTPTAASITQDLVVLRPAFDGLILYGSQTDQLDNGQGLVPWIVAEARRLGFVAVVLGVWNPRDAAELNAAANLVAQHGTSSSFALAVCLGNEGILRSEYTIDDLDRARATLLGTLGGAPVPLATSEDLARYTFNPALRFWGDFLFPIIVPHWNVPGLGPSEAAQWVRQQGAALAEQSGLVVVVKEAGFPSGGRPEYTPDTQRQFFAAYLAGPRTVQSSRFPDIFTAFSTILEAFDQYWKGSPDFTTWGVLGADRTLKPAYGLFTSSNPVPAVSANPSSLQFAYQLGVGAPNPPAQNVSLTNPNGMAAFTVSAGPGWLPTNPTSGTTPSTLAVSVNPTGLAAGQYNATITVISSGSAAATIAVTLSVTGPGGGGALSGLRFVPMVPCRIADTRENQGDFGAPALAPNTARAFPIPLSVCNIPATARAYSLNVTVVPRGPLGYLTIWPTGSAQPFVSTLNSVDGRVKANAALVPAGTGGAVSVFATNSTDLVLDINGYFVEPGTNLQSLAFYPLTPCRVADTRNPNGSLGGPILAAGVARTFLVLAAVNCGIPANAQAYSLNATVVPAGPLGYLTLWPSGSPQPFVSTLNAPTGAIVANAAIVPAGTNGSINALVTNQSHLVLDVNGYFAPPGAANAQRFFTLLPCRLLDTRDAAGEFGGPALVAGGTRGYRLALTSCGLPASATVYSLNATVVPVATLGYLTLWPMGLAQPFVSTLNAVDDPIVANAAIVPAGSAGAVSSFVTNGTHLIFDTNGYFAP